MHRMHELQPSNQQAVVLNGKKGEQHRDLSRYSVFPYYVYFFMLGNCSLMASMTDPKFSLTGVGGFA